MSIESTKADARRLADYLRAKHGWTLKPAAALEAIAVSRGFKDWNTCAASFSAPAATLAPASVGGPEVLTLNEVLEAALKSRATDVIIYRNDNRTSINFRIKGVQTVYYRSGQEAFISLLAEMDEALNFRDRPLPLEIRNGASKRNLGGNDIVLHWAYSQGTAFMIRIVTSSQVRIVDELDDWSNDILAPQFGLFVMAGVTGSGKSTSLKQLMTHASKKGLKVAHVSENSGWEICNHSFEDARGLTNALFAANRTGTDLITVSELRPVPGVAEALLNAASMGTPIVTTMYGASIRQTILQLVQQTGDMDLVFRNLRGVRLQKLLPKVCQACVGAGCEHCHRRGRKGVILVTESVKFDRPEHVQAAANGLTWWSPMKARARALVQDGVVASKDFENAFGALDPED